MPLVKPPAIKAPTVIHYIRIKDEKGRRHYERVRPRSPQLCGPRDSYALLCYVGGTQKWTQCGTDYNEAVRCRALKEQELLREGNEPSDQPKPSADAPRSFRGASERLSRCEEKGKRGKTALL